MSLVAAFLRTAAPQSRGSRAEHHVPSRSGLTIFTTDLLYWIISLRLALRDELLGGLVSVSLAIPLAMGYGMLLSTLSVTAILPMVRLPLRLSMAD
jgi:MFS superfamily sulfate permease-like transporter